MRAHMTKPLTVLLLCAGVASTTACDMRMVTVVGESMSPTYKKGDHVMMSKTVGVLQRGDVVAMYWPKDQSKSFIERIVGLPGESIAIVSGRTVINGKEIDEPYVSPEFWSAETTGTSTIPDGEYFVMGVHRNNSSDSRSWGTVPRELIWAKASPH